MDETYDLTDEPTPAEKPTPAKRPPSPPPLPRIRNYPTADAEPEKPASTKKVKTAPVERKSKPPRVKSPDPVASGEEGERKGVLLEQTPEFDTVETRNRMRIVIALAAVGVVLLVGWMIVKAIPSDEPEFVDDGEEISVPAPPGVAPRNGIEGEARVALADARGFYKRGDTENTIKRLRKIVETYPKSAAAKEAVAAIQRAEQGLPVFLEGNLVDAQNVAVPEPAEAPTIEVAATTPQANLPVGSTLVSVQAPPIPPDPYRELALPLEHGSGAPNLLPAGFRPRIQAGVHTSGWPWEITCDKDGSAMRFIPSGEFLMGRDEGPLQERPSHQVALGGFYIDQHETTALQFSRYQEATHAASPSTADGPPPSDDTPIADVTWRDANAYLKWCGKRLPTEAQWEAAARTIDGRLHPWGPGAPPWPEPREPLPLKSVMSQPLDMSPYGVFDLAGNATEWTADWYDPRYFQQFRDVVAVEPLGPARLRSKLPTRVVKGGSKSWESSWRDGARPDSHNASLGFRGVLPVELLQAPASASPTAPTAPQGPAKGFFAF